MRTNSFTPSALLIAVLLAPSAWSQGAPADQSATTVQPAAELVIKDDAAAAKSATKGKDASGADTLSVDFPDEDIRNILRNVADLFELNLVVPDTLTGRTSIKLRDVSWRQIFQVVLTPVGFSYIVEGNIIKIVSNESLQLEPVTTEVFVLNYARAVDIMPTLTSLVEAGKGGKLVVDGRSNALVITERPSQMNRIRPIIEQLDKATDQVMIESKFVEVTNSDVKNIGVNWSSLNGMQLTAGGLSQTFDRTRGQTRTDGNNVNNNSGATSLNSNGSNTANSTINGTTSGTSTGTTNGTATGTTTGTNNGTTSGTNNSTTTGTTAGNAVTYLSGFDPVSMPTTMTLPAGTVTLPSSVTSTTTMAGTAPAFTAANTYTGGNTNAVTNTTTGTTTGGTTGTTSGSTSGSTTGSTTGGTSGSTSNSLTNTLVNDLSTTASNAITNLAGLANTGGTNRMASAVFSASEFSVILSALKTTNDVKLVSNPTVVTLNNTEAQINIGKEFPIQRYTYNAERGTYEVSGFDYRPIGIILKVTPQVNARGFIKLTLEPEVSSSSESANFGTANIPIVTTRKTKTQVSLKDGFTMGIGGLIENTIQNGQTRVPILGSIPLLGRLFRSDSKNEQTRNLIIFITAKTVSADGAPIEEVFSSEQVRQLQMHRSDLPGYRDGTDGFLPVVEPKKKKK
jgi:type IV pilus assembly protein PilQ